MATLSDADLTRIVQALEARGFTVQRRDASATKVLLEEKYFRRIDKYGGEVGKWQEWLFNLCVAVSGVSPECVVVMEDVVKKAGLIKDITAITVDATIKDKFGSELFGVLCSLTAGEANVVVRSVVQKGVGYCGFAALCLLSQRFNPKTPARILQYLTTVLNPTPVKDVRLLERAVEEWELKQGKLKVEFGEEFSDNVKVAILTAMIPRDLQDMVFQLGHAGKELRYSAVRDKVMSIASHRSQMATPTPMDIGQVEEHEEPYHWEEFEVDAVGKTGACHRCGGRGHFARDCPTPPEGKGFKGKGKAKGEAAKGSSKGGFKTAGKGRLPGKGEASMTTGTMGGGKGFGYQGTCWHCGVVGHKAAECPQWQQISEVAPDPDPKEVANVGGVWMIGQVVKQEREEMQEQNEGEDETTWRLVAGHWRPRCVDRQKEHIDVTQGRFGVLNICPVEKEEAGGTVVEGSICGVRAEITVDSAADESVCPRAWAEQFGTQSVAPGRELMLVNASGGKINHYGSRKVAFHPETAAGRILGVGFEVTDVKKPLMAVSRICEKGNVVQFGPDAKDNFIQNIASGDKLYMKRKGNSYVLQGEFADASPF